MIDAISLGTHKGWQPYRQPPHSFFLNHLRKRSFRYSPRLDPKGSLGQTTQLALQQVRETTESLKARRKSQVLLSRRGFLPGPSKPPPRLPSNTVISCILEEIFSPNETLNLSKGEVGSEGFL